MPLRFVKEIYSEGHSTAKSGFAGNITLRTQKGLAEGATMTDFKTMDEFAVYFNSGGNPAKT